jgi:hypothetical protein
MAKSMTLDARDRRIFRAARDVLNKYDIAERPATGTLRRFDIDGGSAPYLVSVHADWSTRASCSCPDGIRVRHIGLCKHAMAVLMIHDDLRCQLLDHLL